MKTAVSIPDTIFRQADILAHEQGISRSELYARAIEEYINEREEKIIMEKLNEKYSQDDGAMDDVLYTLQYHTIHKNKKW